jgi:hypothetical protein
MVGESLLSLLTPANWQVTAFSRRSVESSESVEWQRPSHRPSLAEAVEKIPYWICVAPISVLPDYFALLETHEVRRIVVLSSTSRFTKGDSSDPTEQSNVRRLIDAEQQVRTWATSKGVEWVILRPTLIYGLGRDKMSPR